MTSSNTWHPIGIVFNQSHIWNLHLRFHKVLQLSNLFWKKIGYFGMVLRNVGDIIKHNRKLRKMFLSPRRESNPQPSDLGWDALTIELPGVRWQREGHDMYRFVSATHVLVNSSVYMSVYLHTYIYSLIRYIDIYRLLFSSTRVALTNRYISWHPLCHLSTGSSMVRASHRRSEGCGFDSRLGLFRSLR